MTLADIKKEVKWIEQNYKEIYDNMVSFTSFLLKRNFIINDINSSFKSVSTYITFESLNYEDELVTVRFSDHAARGNYGTTDVYYGSHLTFEENYNSIINILEER